MILRGLTLSLMLLTAATPLQAGIWERLKSAFVAEEQAEPPTIKVLVLHDVAFADVEVKGTYNLYDPYKNKRIATRFVPKGQRMQSISAGLKWGEEFPSVYQIEIRPDSAEVVTSINNHDYRGKIFVYDIGGTISIVNELTIEDFLASTLPDRLARPLSQETLAAVTIAERTQAFNLAMNGENHYWHVSAVDCGYVGIEKENTNASIATALRSTRYMVLSRTGIYEGVVTPFPVNLIVDSLSRPSPGVKVSVDDLELMSRRGDNAAKMLSKVFPEASIELMVGTGQKTDQIAEVKINGLPKNN